jgi:hypothetical protein
VQVWNEQWDSGRLFSQTTIAENIKRLGDVWYPPYYMEVKNRRYYIFLVVQGRARNEDELI